jgi:hypothetical protein
MDSAVLKFNSEGVTQFINIPPIAVPTLLFSEEANTQHYYPRWAITDYDLPQQATTEVPSDELRGAVGVGWDPGIDTAPAQTPPASAANRACHKIMAAAGVNYGSDALANGAEAGVCDDIFLFTKAAEAGGGFSAADLATGTADIGTRFAPASTFASGLSATNHSMPGAVRDLTYGTRCNCFSYTSPLEPIIDG